MADDVNESEVVRRYREQARTALPRAPLHAALCGVIAEDRSLARILLDAPSTQRMPVLLLAALHSLVLAEPDSELARWYPSVTDEPRNPGDPDLAGALRRFVDDRLGDIAELVTSRQVQTNEVGRCALLVPALGLLADEMGPIAHVDVGTSAGLNTLLHRFAYRYDDTHVIAPGTTDGSDPMVIECGTRHDPPLPNELPTITNSIGIDAAPLDATDPDDARWLQACVWPDQVDRFERLASALDVARAHPPTIRRGDAVELVGSTVTDVAADGHPVLTSTWVMNYLTAVQRHAFLAELDAIAETTDLSWIFAESPAQTPELPHADDLVGQHTTAIGIITWRGGRRTVRHVASAHPHGYWLHWR